MTAWELRRHLAAAHNLDVRGLTWAQLDVLHDDDHTAGADHTHDDEAGHAVPDALYTILLILVILVALHALGVRI